MAHPGGGRLRGTQGKKKFSLCRSASLVVAFVAILQLRSSLSFRRSDTNEKSTSPVKVSPLVTNNETATSLFVNQHCDLTGTSEWFPTTDEAWEFRAPAFMLIGAKKAGTSALTRYLHQHPSIIPARVKEIKFFRAKEARYVLDNDKIHVQQARTMNRRNYPIQRIRETGKVSFDATPYYIFFSAHLPRQILCTYPWIKILAILRDPVERTWSNYNYNLISGQWKGSFEEMIDADFANLIETGVIQGDYSPNLNEEDEAWKRYTEISGINGVVGRSIYVIQLGQWYKAMEVFGRDPKSSIMAVQTEDLDQNQNVVYNRILSFLGLEPHELVDAPKYNTRRDFLSQQKQRLASGEKKREFQTESEKQEHLGTLNRLDNSPTLPEMKPETRKRLETFFAPYNERLYELLGADWNVAWGKT